MTTVRKTASATCRLFSMRYSESHFSFATSQFVTSNPWHFKVLEIVSPSQNAVVVPSHARRRGGNGFDRGNRPQTILGMSECERRSLMNNSKSGRGGSQLANRLQPWFLRLLADFSG